MRGSFPFTARAPPLGAWQRLGCPSCRATLLVGERTWDGPSLAAAVKAPGAGVVSDVVSEKPVQSDKEVIGRVITSHLAEVSACYDASRKTEPTHFGKVVIDFVIGTSGAASSATVASQDETLSKSVGPCILAAIKTWRWPAREAEERALPVRRRCALTTRLTS